MPFERPTLKQLDDRIRNDIAGHARIANSSRAATLLRRSVVAVKSRVYAGACHLIYGFLAWLADQRFVHKMEAEFLDAEGQTYALPRKGSAVATGWMTVTGTDGATVLVDRLYLHESGAQYRVTTPGTIAAGSAKIGIEATEPGVAGNLRDGTILRSIQPFAGVNDDAVVDEEGIVGGVDVESDALYRERILDRKRQPPHGGAAFDYVAWAKEVPGVTRAWCLSLWMGLGTVGVMFMRDGDTDPFPNEDQCREVWDHIEKERPVTAEVFVFPPVRHDIDITVKLSPDTDAIREAVRLELSDFMFRDGAPGAILRISRLSEAISTAAGEHHHELIMPVNDVHIAGNEVPFLGSVYFVDNAEG